MHLRFDPSNFAHVPVYYWPWIWWQLFWLRSWCEATDREVLYEVPPNGRVELVLISDDKMDLRAWLYRQSQAPRPHLEHCNNADGALGADPIAVFIGRQMERFGCFIRWAWAEIAPRKPPVLQDSS